MRLIVLLFLHQFAHSTHSDLVTENSNITNSPPTSSTTTTGPVQIYPHLRGGFPCKVRGKTYRSGEKIPRRNPCHTCVCVRGHIECFWQNCPSPPEGCQEMTFNAICNPSMYFCPIPHHNGTAMRSRGLRYRGRYGSRKLGDGPTRADCVIKGIAYFTGEVIGVASNNCLECRCAKESMYCSPLCCYERIGFDEEDSEKRFRFNWNRRPSDPHPLAHIFEDLGIPPGGSI